jgi:hypothetical protein
MTALDSTRDLSCNGERHQLQVVAPFAIGSYNAVLLPRSTPEDVLSALVVKSEGSKDFPMRFGQLMMSAGYRACSTVACSRSFIFAPVFTSGGLVCTRRREGREEEVTLLLI